MFSSQNSQVSSDVNYIEDVFSTYLYTGNGSTQTITNGIDLSGKGGLVWIKWRSSVYGSVDHNLYDTSRGVLNRIYSNLTAAETNQPNSLTAFNSDGFSLGGTSGTNGSGATYASWTFRECPKFFDVVTYTGTGSAVTVNHNLGSTPGCIIIKATSNTGNWHVWHRSVVDGSGYGYLVLNSTAATAGGKIINSTSSTDFVVASGLSDVGYTYVCYVFAHNAGGFGLTGTDNVISCGSFTTDGSAAATVNLGYEPQWILYKRTDVGSWLIADNMRGNTANASSNTDYLLANTSGAEANTTWLYPTATGFTGTNGVPEKTFIYIAIRRGPMKVPTSGTSVFAPVAVTSSASTVVTTNFPVDMLMGSDRTNGGGTSPVDRLRGGTQFLNTALTNAESNAGAYGVTFDSNISATWKNTSAGYPLSFWNFRRAPSFFDEVCYTGVFTAQTINHNLTVAPEMIITKKRSSTSAWPVYHIGVPSPQVNQPNLNATGGYYANNWYPGAPTSTTFTAQYQDNGSTYVAYLFATCAGVSKVTSFTGNGSSQTINCGFTGGARFVMIKRADSTGNWTIFDTARGISSGGDPALYLNSTAAEVTGVDAIDTDSTGFIVNQESTFNLNVSSATYLVLAIA